MKHTPNALVPVLVAGLLSSLAMACGLPLVPDEASLEDNAITQKMSLVLECRFKAFGPKLAQASLGPEPDLTPLLIPDPDSPQTRAFFILPSSSDRNHNRIYESPNVHFNTSDGSMLIFGLALDSGKAVHTIEFGTQISGVDVSQINFESNITMAKRFDLGYFRLSPTAPGHLVITGPQSNSGNGNGRATIYVLDYPQKNLNDTTAWVASPSSTDGGTQLNPGNPGYFNLSDWKYYPATPASVGPSNSSPPAIPAGLPLVTTTPPPASFGVILVMAQADRFKVLARNSGTGQFLIGDLFPWYAGGLPEQVMLSSSAFTPPADSFKPLENSLGRAFLSYNPKQFQGAMAIAAYQPGPSGLFQYYHALNDPFTGWFASGPFATDWVPTRALADGTLLGLRNGKWTRAAYGQDGQIASASDGTYFRTGSLQFIFEQAESGVTWMYFSQALPVPGDPGRANDLVMRTWKIKESDFVANNAYR